MKFQSSKRLGAKQPNCQSGHVETLHFFRMNLQFYVMTTICVIVWLRLGARTTLKGKEKIVFWLIRLHKQGKKSR